MRNDPLEYTGMLPDYAKNADRKKVVLMLCKGKCEREVWAEMTVEYPGRETLRTSDLFDYKAKCLQCGEVAEYGYNFYRP